MTDKTTADLIKRLSQAIGVTGYRGANNIYEAITAELTPYVDRIERDRMGSLIGFKAGNHDQKAGGEIEHSTSNIPPRKIMIAAHLDEIGAIVTQLDQGFLRFTQIGGLDDRILMGQEVIVHARRDLPGIIGSVPPHLLPPDEPRNRVDQAKMLIDVGLPPREVDKLVRVGDLISFIGRPFDLMNDLISGKAMDNRASVAAMIVCLQQLAHLRHSWDVYAVATADEEWGRYVGATTQAYAIQPDAAIALDVTFADVSEIDIKLNEGPVISLGPSNHPVLRKRLVQLCEKLEMKYQTEIISSGAGTDAFAIEISREGVPTILISLPSRYMHSPVEVVHPKDVERTGRLMAQFIAGLDETFVETLIPV